jgi:RNA polymerase sigma-70 factor (ECF subfamily)
VAGVRSAVPRRHCYHAYRTARRWGETSLQIIDDLVQDIFLKLCSNRARLLREFQLDHPNAIFGFLKLVAVNVANDHFKSSPRR